MSEEDQQHTEVHMQVLVTRLNHFGNEIAEMRNGINKLVEVMTAMAVMEERQLHMVDFQARTVKTLERVEQRQTDHEKACRQQEKDLLAVLDIKTDKLSARVKVLEDSEPLQSQTSKWVMTGMWSGIGVFVMFLISKVMKGETP